MSELMLQAFRALGSAAPRREIATVARVLRESGDPEVGPLLDYVDNPEGWERCCKIAVEADAYHFVALDLAMAFHAPQAFSKLIPDDELRDGTADEN